MKLLLIILLFPFFNCSQQKQSQYKAVPHDTETMISRFIKNRVDTSMLHDTFWGFTMDTISMTQRIYRTFNSDTTSLFKWIPDSSRKETIDTALWLSTTWDVIGVNASDSIVIRKHKSGKSDTINLVTGNYIKQ